MVCQVRNTRGGCKGAGEVAGLWGYCSALLCFFFLVVSIYLDWQMDNAHGNGNGNGDGNGSVGLLDSGLSGGVVGG